MSQIKGSALFLAQYVKDVAPYDTLGNIAAWAKEIGFAGVQIQASDSYMIDLGKAAESKSYCDDLKGQCNGLEITELAAWQQANSPSAAAPPSTTVCAASTSSPKPSKGPTGAASG